MVPIININEILAKWKISVTQPTDKFCITIDSETAGILIHHITCAITPTASLLWGWLFFQVKKNYAANIVSVVSQNKINLLFGGCVSISYCNSGRLEKSHTVIQQIKIFCC